MSICVASAAFFPVSDHLLLYARQLIMWVILLISPTPGGSGIADGGAKIADKAHVQTPQVLDQPVMVERERAGKVRHSGKDNQPQPVTGPFADEFLQDLGRDIEA